MARARALRGLRKPALKTFRAHDFYGGLSARTTHADARTRPQAGLRLRNRTEGGTERLGCVSAALQNPALVGSAAEPTMHAPGDANRIVVVNDTAQNDVAWLEIHVSDGGHPVHVKAAPILPKELTRA